ncbi:histidine N-acetyltransferase-like [Haliotis rubra]|uniref:histidine N-acetyltransferase-like n=1 Tax=Haliotis rubra TaxID=36100 RepID=UPI001EE54D85|nr:histidine N-acetyltransferase-like [Haliotis rubra]
MAKHDIRRATRYDFADVMRIGDVYDGKDYLCYRYKSFLDDPNNRSYIYMVGHAVVGFSASFLIDGGQTLLCRSGRVKASFQGQGIFRTLKKYNVMYYTSSVSQVARLPQSTSINMVKEMTKD